MFESNKIIVLVPAYNEQGKIGNTVRKIKKHAPFVDQILVIDDGSTDKTHEEAEREGAKLLKNASNKGVGYTLKKGMKYALDYGYNVCVITSGDDQDDKTDIEKFVRCVVTEDYDFVLGSRYLGSTQDMNLFRKISTKMFTKLFNFVAGTKITDASNGFRAFKTELAAKINIWQDWIDNYEMEPYFLYHVVRRFKTIEMPTFKSFEKEKGYTKMVPFVSWWRITRPLIYLKLGLKK